MEDEIVYKDYRKMQMIIGKLLDEIEADLDKEELKFDPKIVLCGRFGVDVTPRPNTYKYTPEGKEDIAFKEKSREQIEHLIAHTYGNKFNREYKEEIGILSDAFLYGDDIFIGPIHLDFPYEIFMDVASKQNDFSDGKEPIAIIVRYWAELLKENEDVLEDEEVIEDNAEPETVVKPKFGKYGYNREEDPHAYEPLPTRSRDFDFDDDASNWSYNERHND
ncbi:hypothetical protein BBI15_10155 [Planococcus plakortidis]|uniref:Uncharacterized protein n=1 Tax=Planococcus plakortidis TaxID=1038856 RepID=A0A1C7E980_9BACL|nr:hypothetical protein [Planococcus plakortidis]ANU20553.1 hypothetical protein BBI15_10155 [Planococcus plakortidis]